MEKKILKMCFIDCSRNISIMLLFVYTETRKKYIGKCFQIPFHATLTDESYLSQ